MQNTHCGSISTVLSHLDGITGLWTPQITHCISTRNTINQCYITYLCQSLSLHQQIEDKTIKQESTEMQVQAVSPDA